MEIKSTGLDNGKDVRTSRKIINNIQLNLNCQIDTVHIEEALTT